MKNVLFITYVFPPVGGAGVQRTVKFLKYLRRHGWQGSVLTAANPSVPVTDNSLLTDIPADTEIVRARTLEPRYSTKEVVSASGGGTPRSGKGRALCHFRQAARRAANALLQPDPQVLWAPGAIRQGTRFLKANPHDAILATAPPFSVFIVGAILARRAGIPLVTDYRDEWGLSNKYFENRRPGLVSTAIQERMQAALMRRTQAIVATTRASADALKKLRNRCDSEARVTWIYNGFDEDDLRTDAAPERGGGKFRIVYTGTLWNLMSVQPFVRAIQRLAELSPSEAAKLEIVFVGRRTAEQDQIVQSLAALPCTLTLKPYVNHDEAVKLMSTADQLLILLNNAPGAERWVPAKVFEYMAMRRPILAIAPPGELTEILDRCPRARTRHPDDPDAIANAILHAMQEVSAGGIPVAGDFNVSRYSREAEAGQLARVLDAVTGREADLGPAENCPVPTARCVAESP